MKQATRPLLFTALETGEVPVHFGSQDQVGLRDRTTDHERARMLEDVSRNSEECRVIGDADLLHEFPNQGP